MSNPTSRIEIMGRVAVGAALAALATVLLLFVYGCGPGPDGNACSPAGSVYSHDGTNLACGQDGKWHK